MATTDVEFDAAELITLLDEMACRKVIGRYGSALDWRDEAALASTVWPDAVIDYGFFKGSGEEFVQAFMPIERAAGRPFHILVTEQLEVRSPFADAESLGFSLTFETPHPD
jgi:SnoaL-like domain